MDGLMLHTHTHTHTHTYRQLSEILCENVFLRSERHVVVCLWEGVGVLILNPGPKAAKSETAV